MLEKALTGTRRYWTLLIVLAGLLALGGFTYLRQLNEGLVITGMHQSVSWGFYIAQFTFLVGVAASAVMVVLPYYLHSYKAFGKVVILGEFLAVSAVTMCMLFIVVDLGQPARAMNMILHPTPNSLLFWDMISLNGYLILNVVISRVSLDCERKGVKPPSWIKPVIIISIPWAISIHTVTAFIYCGLEARPFWMTAILAPRFLASAFASGPALLILLCLLLRKLTKFHVGDEPIGKLAQIVTYGMLLNVFFILMELFTGLYSDMPEHAHHLLYPFIGLEGHSALVPWMWTSAILAIASLVLLIWPKVISNTRVLGVICAAVILSIWIDKGMVMVVAGQVPSVSGHVVEYSPTFPELLISIGIYALGALILTVLYKVAVGVREAEMA